MINNHEFIQGLDDLGFKIVLAVGMHPDNGKLKMAVSSGFYSLPQEDLIALITSIAVSLRDMREVPMDDWGFQSTGGMNA